MHFNCKKCGIEVSHSEADSRIFEEMGWRCPGCWLVISTGEYEPKNIKDGLTIFSAVGGSRLGVALGDWVISEVITRKYREDNPDEKVIELNYDDDHIKASKRRELVKFFVNEFNRTDTDGIPNMIRFRLINEVNEYARRGIYPQLRFEPEPMSNGMSGYKEAISREYVVLHIRNIEKSSESPNPGRNMNVRLACKIIDMIRKDYNIIILGNDKIDTWFRNWKGVYDFRNMLTLPQIAWIIGDAKLFVGRDSGMAHLAAACGAKIVAWNYNGDKWFPKCPKENYVALMKGQTDDKTVLSSIEQML